MQKLRSHTSGCFAAEWQLLPNGFAMKAHCCIAYSSCIGVTSGSLKLLWVCLLTGSCAGTQRHHSTLPTADGRLPLHLAALRGHAEVVKFLLSKDAVWLEAQDADDNSALHLAARCALRR